MRRATVLAALIYAVIIGGPAYSKSAGQTVDPKEAAAALQAGDYPRAERLFRAIVDAKPDAPFAWYRLGYAVHAQGKYQEAIEIHQRASEFDEVRAPALYNLACAHAMLGHDDDAFSALENAIESGFDNIATMRTDTDLTSLHADDRWNTALERVVSAASETPNRQFDFWVGSWDVFNPQGVKVGTNIITARQNGHIIHESWTNMQGITGDSINFFDPARQKWRQVWIDQGGGVVEYEGAFEDGAMRMTGKNVDGAGKEVLSRVAFTPQPDGRVRQFIEHSEDAGATWTVYFDGYYQRQQQPADE